MRLVDALRKFMVPSIDGKFALEVRKNEYDSSVMDLFAVCEVCGVALPPFMRGIKPDYECDEASWKQWAGTQEQRILGHREVCRGRPIPLNITLPPPPILNMRAGWRIPEPLLPAWEDDEHADDYDEPRLDADEEER